MAQFPDFSIAQLREETPYKNKIELWKLNRETKDSEEPEEEITNNIVLQNDNYYDDIEFELLERLKNMGNNTVNKGTLFETLCLELLKKMGYGEYQRMGGAGDYGVDGILSTDKLGLTKIGIQCKCHSNNISADPIAVFAQGLKKHGIEKGVFLTTSDFTDQAKNVTNEVNKNIILIGGKKLANLFREYEIGIKIIQTNYIYDITIGENT